jgi:hypothetical protein
MQRERRHRVLLILTTGTFRVERKTAQEDRQPDPLRGFFKTSAA